MQTLALDVLARCTFSTRCQRLMFSISDDELYIDRMATSRRGMLAGLCLFVATFVANVVYHYTKRFISWLYQ